MTPTLYFMHTASMRCVVDKIVLMMMVMFWDGKNVFDQINDYYGKLVDGNLGAWRRKNIIQSMSHSVNYRVGQKNREEWKVLCEGNKNRRNTKEKRKNKSINFVHAEVRQQVKSFQSVGPVSQSVRTEPTFSRLLYSS